MYLPIVYVFISLNENNERKFNQYLEMIVEIFPPHFKAIIIYYSFFLVSFSFIIQTESQKTTNSCIYLVY